MPNPLPSAFSRALALAALLVVATPAAQAGEPWAFDPGARRPVPEGCVPSMPADVAAYPICEDQVALLDAAIRRAAASGKLLLVELGATWCPYCARLKRALPAILAMKASGGFEPAAAFETVAIGVSTVRKGKKQDVESGLAVLDALMRKAPEAEVRGWPFLVALDPADASRVFSRNTADLESDGPLGYDPERMLDALASAQAYLRTGTPPPAEPERGWLSRLYHAIVD